MLAARMAVVQAGVRAYLLPWIGDSGCETAAQ